ncbi:MAG: iron ABC transporter permease, partial [Clostridiales bacterium]|nr:iron ABC transporter permease [Clostridiales bacterium]
MKGKAQTFTIKMMVLLGVLAGCFFLSFMVGRYPISPGTVWDIIRSQVMYVKPYWEETLMTVVLQVRLPRIIMGILVGGSLSI